MWPEPPVSPAAIFANPSPACVPFPPATLLPALRPGAARRFAPVPPVGSARLIFGVCLVGSVMVLAVKLGNVLGVLGAAAFTSCKGAAIAAGICGGGESTLAMASCSPCSAGMTPGSWRTSTPVGDTVKVAWVRRPPKKALSGIPSAAPTRGPTSGPNPPLSTPAQEHRRGIDNGAQNGQRVARTDRVDHALDRSADRRRSFDQRANKPSEDKFGFEGVVCGDI